MVRAFNKLVEVRGKPNRIRLDNRPEFISHELAKWASDRNIVLQFILKGRPTQNAYIERFNRTYRHGVLDCYVFNSLAEVRAATQDWIHHYNHHRPHEASGRIPPVSFHLAKSP